MEPLFNLIMGDSTALDAAVLIRLILILMAMEFVSLIIGYISGLRR